MNEIKVLIFYGKDALSSDEIFKNIKKGYSFVIEDANTKDLYVYTDNEEMKYRLVRVLRPIDDKLLVMAYNDITEEYGIHVIHLPSNTSNISELKKAFRSLGDILYEEYNEQINSEIRKKKEEGLEKYCREWWNRIEIGESF